MSVQDISYTAHIANSLRNPNLNLSPSLSLNLSLNLSPSLSLSPSLNLNLSPSLNLNLNLNRKPNPRWTFRIGTRLLQIIYSTRPTLGQSTSLAIRSRSVATMPLWVRIKKMEVTTPSPAPDQRTCLNAIQSATGLSIRRYSGRRTPATATTSVGRSLLAAHMPSWVPIGKTRPAPIPEPRTFSNGLSTACGPRSPRY